MHDNHKKFCKNMSSCSVPVVIELHWVGWGLLRLLLVYMRSELRAMSTSHLTSLSVRNAAVSTSEKFSSMKFEFLPVARYPYEIS
jgi:hypothetical protein